MLANMAMMATVIISSTKVKPLDFRDKFFKVQPFESIVKS
jgi:hypothetical protein